MAQYPDVPPPPPIPDPNAPPESIILQNFAGIKNTVAPERLTSEELEAAVNVDIDDAGQVRRRRGYTRKATGSYHSLFNTATGAVLGVKNGDLGWIRPDYSFQLLQAGAGLRPLAYVQVGDDVYFASEITSGVVHADSTVSAWGRLGGPGTWVSPVMTPTDTLGAIAGKLIAPPSVAQYLTWYKGRIYLAAGRLLWATELFAYDWVDKTRNFYQFEYDITAIWAATDGLYVGTAGALYFLAGTFADGFKRNSVGDFAVFPGSVAEAPASVVHPMRRFPVAESGAMVFLTTDGICAAFDSGQVYNLTHGQVVFPDVVSAAAIYRETDGLRQYIAVADSGGTPSSNARIGDYVDATVVRFSGG